MTAPGASIAISPFRNLSSDPDAAYFANGFVEDLAADLTRFASLRVLAFAAFSGARRQSLLAAQRVREMESGAELRRSAPSTCAAIHGMTP